MVLFNAGRRRNVEYTGYSMSSHVYRHAMMKFHDQDRQYLPSACPACCHPERMSRSPERSEGEGSPLPAEPDPTLSLRVTSEGSGEPAPTLLTPNDCRYLERRLPVSGCERGLACHPERSEGSVRAASQILRCAQDDTSHLQIPAILLLGLMRNNISHRR